MLIQPVPRTPATHTSRTTPKPSRTRSRTTRLFLALALPFLVASDHLDGRSPFDHRFAQVADIYAWTPAEGRLALVLDAHSMAGSRARFREDVTYQWRLRPASISGIGEETKVRVEGTEAVITCNATRGKTAEEDRIRCAWSGPGGEGAISTSFEQSTTDGGARLYAALTRDPFFGDVALTYRKHPRDGETLEPGGADSLDQPLRRGRVLALVLEVDVDTLMGDEPGLVAVIGETFMDGVRFDRLGRPETANFILASTFGETLPHADVRTSWNAEDAFALSEGHRHYYEHAMAEGLIRLDKMDEGEDWPRPHPFQELLLLDVLLVDPSRPCSVDDPTWMEIEMAHLQGLPEDEAGKRHRSCGGRPPNDDIIDTLLTLYINGPDRVPAGQPLYGDGTRRVPRRGDNVNRAPHPAVDTFPYIQK